MFPNSTVHNYHAGDVFFYDLISWAPRIIFLSIFYNLGWPRDETTAYDDERGVTMTNSQIGAFGGSFFVSQLILILIPPMQSLATKFFLFSFLFFLHLRGTGRWQHCIIPHSKRRESFLLLQNSIRGI